ncbi:MAG: YidC/Oxa1 family membrane protein insertase [Treponema sp.]|nr:YidC/Oxa1 family membrane protein insertase [Treponema sp.]
MEILYNIIIYPLVQIIEFVFVFAEKVFKETGVSIVAVSGAVSLLCLPLYNTAEKWQGLERDIQKKLKPKMDKIKATFKGDEQYMILSTYYRQNHYHPVFALRGTLGLLIQVPFFIAAYSYLSHLEVLKGVRFLFINDLGAPDGLLKIWGGRGNLLPVLMTLVNIISGAIYSKGLPARDKIQLYGMAALFLVLLYDSPAGLAMYWTFNNIFSLVKNCAGKTRYRGKILRAAFFTISVLTVLYLLFFNTARLSKRLPVIAILTIFILALIFINIIKKTVNKFILIIDSRGSSIVTARIALGGTVILLLLSGLVIPSALIASSTGEFSFIEPYESPLPFICTTMLQSAGFFLFWCPFIYFFFSNKVKVMFSVLLSIISVAALINTFAFSGNYGFLTTTLMFSTAKGFNFDPLFYFFNIFVIVSSAAACIIFYLSKRKVLFCSIQIILIITLVGFGINRIIKIKTDFTDITSRKISYQADADSILKPVYHFSRNGRNVIVIMLDRAISGYIPYIFEERPDLQESFSGFTWYPNCVSLGGATLFGMPPLFGGYDYSPDKVQEQEQKLLVETWNESLLVLPRLFSENDFYITITDPTFANFVNAGDLSIYSAYPNIYAENLHNRFTSYWIKNHPDIKLLALSSLLKNNLIHFSFFKMSPLFFREMLYNSGDWMVVNDFTVGNNRIDKFTLDNYAMLDVLPEITTVNDTDVNTYTAIINDLTHEPAFFEAPEYSPSNDITNYGSSPFAEENHYHANMAALILLGKWFDYLKRQGVYDNSRIIISADHGWNYNTKLPNFTLPNGASFVGVNPLLLVKDFKDAAKEESAGIKTDYTFMSHADVPYLAGRGITEAVNPFTGNSLHYDKSEGITITTRNKWEAIDTRKYKWNIQPTEWLHVRDNAFNPDNWERADR